MIIDPTPNFISRTKATSNRLQPGGTYIANVTRVHGGQVYVTVPKLGTKDEFGPCFVVGIVPSAGDRVVVAFLNNMMTELICLGTFTSRPLSSHSPTITGTLTAEDIEANAINAVSISSTSTISASASISAPTVSATTISATTLTGFTKNRMQFVEVGNGGRTLTSTDDGKMLRLSSYSGNNTITVPTDASVPFAIGTEIHVVATNLYSNTIAAAAGVTLLTSTGTTLRTRWSVATLVKYSTTTWHVFGDLAV